MNIRPDPYQQAFQQALAAPPELIRAMASVVDHAIHTRQPFSRVRALLAVLACVALLGCLPPPRCRDDEQVEVIKTDAGPYYYCGKPRR